MKKTSDPIIARHQATRPIPSWGKGRPLIHVDAKAYTLGGNQHPYFSVTATIDDQWTRPHNNCRAAGCLHEEILRLFPALAPIVALHLSDAITGEPSAAEANGWYWMAGALPNGAGEKYHGGKDKSPDECLAILASHLRIPLGSKEEAETARWLLDICQRANHPRAYFTAFVDAQRGRWQAEAQAGIALLRQLTERQTQKRAEREACKLATA